MKTLRLFTVVDGQVAEGAAVRSFRLSNGTEIPAIVVGESGRGRRLGVLPVSGVPEGGCLVFAVIGTTRAGHPRLIASSGSPSGDEVILVLRTGIGFRGGNAHTGDVLPDADRCAERPGTVLVHGQIAQGDAGRMGSGDQMVLVLQKGQVLRVARMGRLYGAVDTHFYRWDGEKLLVSTEEDRVVADLF